MSHHKNISEALAPELISESGNYTIAYIDDSGRARYRNEVSVLDHNPFEFDASGMLPPGEHMDLARFYEVAGDVIDYAQEREGTIAAERVQLVKDFQPERVSEFGDEVIAVKVRRRMPANMSKDAKSRPQRASNFAYDLRMAQHPNKIIVVESRPIDHEIEFSCWAVSATLADARALWLEKLFVTHAWAFQVQGVERFLWTGRGSDTLWKTSEQRVHQRPLTFFVRLREFEVYAHPILREVLLEVQT